MSVLGVCPLDFEAIRQGYMPPGVSRKHIEEFRASSLQVQELAARLSALAAAQINPTINGPLKEEDIPQEVGQISRPLIVRIYNHLQREGQLGILNQPTDSLFKWRSNEDFVAHPAIRAIAQKYMKDVWVGDPTFAFLLSHVQALKDGRLSDLQKFVLEDRKKGYDEWVDAQKGQIQKEYETYQNALSFAEGDFSFISHAPSRRYLSHAYTAITEENKWEGLAPEYPDEHFAFLQACREHGLSGAMSKLDRLDGHTGGSMAYVMRNMHHLKHVGWEQFVMEWLNHASRRQE